MDFGRRSKLWDIQDLKDKKARGHKGNLSDKKIKLTISCMYNVVPYVKFTLILDPAAIFVCHCAVSNFTFLSAGPWRLMNSELGFINCN